MPARKHKAEEIIGKLREAEIVPGQGGTTAEARRRAWDNGDETTFIAEPWPFQQPAEST